MTAPAVHGWEVHMLARAIRLLILVCLTMATAASLKASSLEVQSHQKISDTEGGFTGSLMDSTSFGQSLALLGDLDGDGSDEVAVGAPHGDGLGANRGAVWVLTLDDGGAVAAYQEISDGAGGFGGTLDDDDEFGWSVTSLGDLDGDEVADLAVGARRDGDGGERRGAVWVLFLRGDGTVAFHQKISDTEGEFDGVLDGPDWFGSAIAPLGDTDGDGQDDLAVGAPKDDDGGEDRGAVWVLFHSDKTPVFLSFFDARVSEGQVAITWQVTADSEPASFRLEAERTGDVWRVPHVDRGRNLYSATDHSENLRAGGRVTYRLYSHQRGSDWILLGSRPLDLIPAPSATGLIGAHPNPFNPQTTIRFCVHQSTFVRLTVHSVDGRLVKVLGEQAYGTGTHDVVWSGGDMTGRPAASGVYFVRLQAGDATETWKVALAK